MKVNIKVKIIACAVQVSHISKNDVALFFAVQLLLLEKHGVLKSLRSIVGKHLAKQNANKR